MAPLSNRTEKREPDATCPMGILLSRSIVTLECL
jgi:hypothetical protein